MNDASPTWTFLAVLIYDEGNGRCCEEPRVYEASHPEIAYHLALVAGNEQRYGRRFVGLSHLEETTEEVETIATSKKGDAEELVVEKNSLAAFSDSRWSGVACDEEELADALREPPLLVEVNGLEKVRWHESTHAYGTASELPKDIRRLASSDPKIRNQALWELEGSIYHQGTIYPATVLALPFLIRLASDSRIPDRAEIWELLDVIAESCTIDPEKIREAWVWRRKNFGEIYAKPSGEMAEDELADIAAVRAAFLQNIEVVRQWKDDAEVGKPTRSILGRLEGGPSSP